MCLFLVWRVVCCCCCWLVVGGLNRSRRKKREEKRKEEQRRDKQAINQPNHPTPISLPHHYCASSLPSWRVWSFVSLCCDCDPIRSGDPLESSLSRLASNQPPTHTHTQHTITHKHTSTKHTTRTRTHPIDRCLTLSRALMARALPSWLLRL